MPDLLDQLQLLVGCEYLSDMRVVPYINEQAKLRLRSLSLGDFSSFYFSILQIWQQGRKQTHVF